MPRIQMPSKAFAALYDRLNKGAEDAGVREWRAGLLAGATGPTLEIGAGTGLNLEHYPPAVTRLVLLEPDPGMAARLQGRLDASGRQAELVSASAVPLPFADGEFETVVVTLVLCSVPDPGAALAEIRRVLAPGGRMLFMEHVRSENPKTARLQDRIRPLYNVIGRGCNPNRETLATLEASGLAVESVRRETVPKAPRTENEAILGVARAAA